MIFKRPYAIIHGDNMNGLQLVERAKIIDLLVTDLPKRVEGNWKRSVSKRIKLAHKVLSSKGAIAILVDREYVHDAEDILNEEIGIEHFILSVGWKQETLLVYGKANVYSEERIDTFLRDIEGMDRWDQKRAKKLGVPSVRNVQFLKAIIRTFSEEEDEILDIYAGSGMVGLAVWELNYEEKGHRGFTLISHDIDNVYSSVLYPHIHKQSLIYESPFDYVVLGEDDE